MDPEDQIQFLEKVISFVKTGNGELSLKTLDFSRREFTVLVLSSATKDVLTLEEKRFVAAAKPIEAIKSVRERTGCSLAEAKEVVDKYRAKIGITGPLT